GLHGAARVRLRDLKTEKPRRRGGTRGGVLVLRDASSRESKPRRHLPLLRVPPRPPPRLRVFPSSLLSELHPRDLRLVHDLVLDEALELVGEHDLAAVHAALRRSSDEEEAAGRLDRGAEARRVDAGEGHELDRQLGMALEEVETPEL